MTVGEQAVVRIDGVRKVFKDFWLRPRVVAVHDLTLTIEPGEALGLLGPNGSGKSTTIKMILGLLFPTRGRIAVLGKRPTDVRLKARVGYLPEESTLYRFLNAVEVLEFFGRLFSLPRRERRRRAEMLLEMVGLSNVRYRPVAEYSKGMHRRLGLAQALINDPELLILDEPTAGMDPLAARQIKDLILELRGRGKTIILCTHLLSEVEDVCSRLAILFGGRLQAHGTMDALLSEGERQTIEVPKLKPDTVEQVRQLIGSQEGASIEVTSPRRRLEDLFLDVVKTAETAAVETSGAVSGGPVAEFLVAVPTPGAPDSASSPPAPESDRTASAEELASASVAPVAPSESETGPESEVEAEPKTEPEPGQGREPAVVSVREGEPAEGLDPAKKLEADKSEPCKGREKSLEGRDCETGVDRERGVDPAVAPARTSSSSVPRREPVSSDAEDGTDEPSRPVDHEYLRRLTEGDDR